MIKLERVTVRHGSRAALSDVTIDVARGTTLAVLGPSGGGKSTLLRVVVGLALPDAGSVRVADVAPVGPARLSVQRRIGYVIQEGGLFPHLTARDNVSLLARHVGWQRERIAGRIDALLGLVRLPPDALARHPQELSGGQRQRVALMRALMLDPEILLLDEPLAALDPLVRAELQDELRALILSLKKTVVLVTHDLAEAVHFAGSLVILRDGALIARGSFEELRASTDPFVARYLSAQRALSLPTAEHAPTARA